MSPFVTNDDTGTTSVYYTRPYPNPTTTGPADAYLWIGSTDHGSGPMYRGYSSSPDVAPSSWTTFSPPGGFFSPETPCFVYDPAEARPFRLYYHPAVSESGGDQQTRLATYADDWTGGVDEGEVLPATANPSGTTLLVHTGYAFFERRSATDWHAWSLTRGGENPTWGYWTSSDGETWTCVNDDLDVTSMVASGRRLDPSHLTRFSVGGSYKAVVLARTDGFGGGVDADAGVEVVVADMADEETFSNVRVVWSASGHGVTDNIRDVRALQDPDDETLVHIYVHSDRTDVYYDTFTI